VLARNVNFSTSNNIFSCIQMQGLNFLTFVPVIIQTYATFSSLATKNVDLFNKIIFDPIMMKQLFIKMTL
jgi:hypothetical protein